MNAIPRAEFELDVITGTRSSWRPRRSLVDIVTAIVAVALGAAFVSAWLIDSDAKVFTESDRLGGDTIWRRANFFVYTLQSFDIRLVFAL